MTTTAMQGAKFLRRTSTQHSSVLTDEPSSSMQRVPGAGHTVASAVSTATGHAHVPSVASSDAGSSKTWLTWGGVCTLTRPPVKKMASGWTSRQRLLGVRRFLGFGQDVKGSTMHTVSGEDSL